MNEGNIVQKFIWIAERGILLLIAVATIFATVLSSLLVISNLLGLIKAFQFLSIIFDVGCIYTLLLFGGLAPLCGIGVVSLIDKILKPLDCKDLNAVSLPEPGPFT